MLPASIAVSETETHGFFMSLIGLGVLTLLPVLFYTQADFSNEL
jgi:hypothetical protein